MVVRHERLPSTMDAAHAMAEAGAEHGAAVTAREQGTGRGRRGRVWVSARGGLWLSVVCRPPDAMGMDHLSLRVGLAVAEALETLLPTLPRIAIKRPNDLLVSGRKVAGILCEARWEGPSPSWVVVGLGLNVTNQLGPSIAETATTLAREGVDGSPDTLAEPLARAIAAAALAGGPLTAAEEARLTARERPA